MPKQTTHMPLHIVSQRGFCSACAHLASVIFFHIKVLVWWVPAGVRVGALSQGCACGPNPLISSASTGCRWHIGTETGCTPPIFLPQSHPHWYMAIIANGLLLVCFVAYDALLVCVFAHVCAHPLCCSIDDVYRSLVQLSTKTGESLDVCRTVESAVTWKTSFVKAHLYNFKTAALSDLNDMLWEMKKKMPLWHFLIQAENRAITHYCLFYLCLFMMDCWKLLFSCTLVSAADSPADYPRS